MQQIGHAARERCPARLQPVILRVLQTNPLPPGGRPSTHRRPRPVAALLWLGRLLFVRPIGRRARADRLGGLGDGTLRDLGILRADVQAAALGLVPLHEVLPRYPGDGRVACCAARRHPPRQVRIGEAA